MCTIILKVADKLFSSLDRALAHGYTLNLTIGGYTSEATRVIGSGRVYGNGLLHAALRLYLEQ